MHILCPFGEIYSQTSFPDVFLIKFPIMFFPCPWSSSQFIDDSPWVSEQPFIWPFVLPNCNTMWTARNFTHCRDFPLAISFRVVPETGYNVVTSLLDMACMACSTISKPGARLLFFRYPIRGNTKGGYTYFFGNRQLCQKNKRSYLGNFFVRLVCAFRAC